jgi:phage shock protein A
MKLSEQLRKNGNFKLAEQAGFLEDTLVKAQQALFEAHSRAEDLDAKLAISVQSHKQTLANHDAEIAQVKAIVEQARNLLRQI